MKKRLITLVIAFTVLTGTISAQDMEPRMQAVFEACVQMQTAIGSGSNSGLRVASKMLKECNPRPFTTMRICGDEISLNGHFVFDYEFADSLIENRNVYDFAQRYADRFAMRSTSSTPGSVFTKTCLVEKESSIKFTITSRGHQELAFVTEPGGNITIRIHDITNDNWYNDNEKEKEGKSTRLAIFDLPIESICTLEVEVINKSKENISFVVIAN